jgi:hypothetical protein
MVDRIREARRLVVRASDETDDETVREQLRSISDGLATLEEDHGDAAQQGERLEQVESKLVALANETGGEEIERIAEVRDLVDAYRRDRAQDW